MSPVLRYRSPASGLFEQLLTSAPVQDLDSLTDVDVTTTPPADGDGLVYDAASGQWVPGTASVGFVRLAFDVTATGGVFALRHNLGEQFVAVQVYNPDGEQVAGAVDLIDANTVLWTTAGTNPGVHTAVILGSGGTASAPIPPASEHPGTLAPTWSGGEVSFLAGGNSVTARIYNVTWVGAMQVPADSWTLICALPAGVAPPSKPIQWQAAYGVGDSFDNFARFEVRADGVWIGSYQSRLIPTGRTFHATCSWTT